MLERQTKRNGRDRERDSDGRIERSEGKHARDGLVGETARKGREKERNKTEKWKIVVDKKDKIRERKGKEMLVYE